MAHHLDFKIFFFFVNWNIHTLKGLKTETENLFKKELKKKGLDPSVACDNILVSKPVNILLSYMGIKFNVQTTLAFVHTHTL